ncbi:DUF5680 domain-containing protein [Oryzibacter oryziterrae]|uniref:DUF5680 domain-containing protein n=1 Tax=Oryzibacter oryziterrae TaxID=2766474 RepID=UPI001F30D6B2|nr:DUF5680 domain-containing protein [Oryzibacter oryziterrae]
MPDLNSFIIRAKAATYAGGGANAPSSRTASHDLAFAHGDFRYLDSYFGGSDFAGQETVWLRDEPVWVMNYFGRILRDDLITGHQAGILIKAALSALYTESRFLGGHRFAQEDLLYIDMSDGDFSNFFGYEEIRRKDVRVYELRYCGGRVRP